MANNPPFVTISRVENKKATQNPEWIVTAQFNPESLQIKYEAKSKSTNSTVGRQNGPNRTGTTGQRTGMEIKLSEMTLIFDTTFDGSDVRQYTLKLAKFIMAEENGKKITPTVQFQWGTLLFQGTIDGMTETLEYFSADGKPLRAAVAIRMTMTAKEKASNSDGNGLTDSGAKDAGFSSGVSAGQNASNGISAGSNINQGSAVGTTGLTIAQSGASIQAMSAQAGLDWKAVAELNGIENPRFVQSGAVLNMNANATASAKLTVNS